MPVKTNLTPETKVQLLMQMSQCVQNAFDLDEVLEALLDTILMIIDYDAAGIFVINRDSVAMPYQRPHQEIAGVVMRGFSEIPAHLDPMMMQGKGIVGKVIANGEPIVLPDVRMDGDYVAGRSQTLSEITLPLVLNDRVIGALNLESDRLGAYTQDDLEPLRFFAEAAVISIEKALLHNQILEAQRIDAQLETAREVQRRLLPESPPNIPGYDISGLCLPTYAIGGDYFDYLSMGEGRLGVVIADVAGDGIPAALVMSAFRALLRSQASQVSSRDSRSSAGSAPLRQTSPSRFISRVNRLLPEISGFTTFVTAVFGILNPDKGDFLYSVCGHHPPIFSRQGGLPRLMRKDGTALGVVRRARYRTQKIQMGIGDILLLYTDGVVELENAEGDPFGAERLKSVVTDNMGKTSREVIQAVVNAVQAFTNLEAFPDDFTLLAIRRIPRSPGSQKTRRHQRPIDIIA